MNQFKLHGMIGLGIGLLLGIWASIQYRIVDGLIVIIAAPVIYLSIHFFFNLGNRKKAEDIPEDETT